MYQGFKSFLRNSTQSVYRGNHTPPSPRGSWFVSRVCAKSRLNARMFTANVAVRRESDANEPGAVGALMEGGEGEGIGEDRRGGREGKEGRKGSGSRVEAQNHLVVTASSWTRKRNPRGRRLSELCV